MDCRSTSIQVFRNGWLSTRAGFASKSTSSSTDVEGNKVVLSATVLNVTGAATVSFFIDASYNGLVWKQLVTGNQNTFGYTTLSQATLDYAFVRARVEITGTDQDVLFDVSLAFSAQ